MPEIKNTFLQGKMNKDLDERLVPNGQYRHAMNVEVSTSESSDIGVVKNILGNHRIEDIVGDEFKCVGSIANEKTNKLYWFISSYETDAILEYDIENSSADNFIVKPVLVDTNAGNYKAVLKFSGNIITGINIIDNLLFWTDNNSDPKKINIDECKRGTPVDALDGDVGDYKHTQLIFDNGSFDGITLEQVRPDVPGAGDEDKYYTWEKGRYFVFQRKQMAKLLGVNFEDFIDEYGNIVGSNNMPPTGYDSSVIGYQAEIRHYRAGKFLGVKNIGLYENRSGIAARFHPSSEATDNDWHKGDIVFGNDIRVDIEERHITVIKTKPVNTLSVKINHTENPTSTNNIPNLFETKFPRFSYRYKFRDGEYSPFAPFTTPVFNPKYPKDTSVSSDTPIFYDKDTAYDIKEPYNKAMVNSIHSVELTDFINAQTPEDVVEVDILYKQEESSVIYSIDTIKHTDRDWHRWSNNEGVNIGRGRQFMENMISGDISAWGYAANGGHTKGKYIVTTENIYAALPANQLLRPWDNVPRKALAQEITGNRIVYGNYVQNYDLVENAQVSVSYSDRKNNIGSFTSQGLPSIKSQRNYQLGVIYCDKYGRETPVLTSKNAAINVPWQDSSGNKNASKSTQLNSSVATNFPEWVDSLKFFIKETSNPYYNLTMDRAWVTKSTYELDDSEGHLWISFPSSDRNKISEEDYIILKKKIGTGEEQVNLENKYKVIDIKNEAPDAIKYRLINYVAIHNYPSAATYIIDNLFSNTARRIDHRGNDVLWLKRDLIDNTANTAGPFSAFGGASVNEGQEVTDSNSGEGPLKTKDLYISWRRSGALSGDYAASKKYKITGGQVTGSNYELLLSTPITKIDADIAHIDGISVEDPYPSGTTQLFHPDLILQIEKKELKDTEDFSGKFFVKISKNQVTDIIETGNVVDIRDQYQVSAKAASWAWRDDVGGNKKVTSSGYGLINYNGSAGGSMGLPDSQENSIQYSRNNEVGDWAADRTQAATDYDLYVTDYWEPWQGIFNKLDVHGRPQGTFFVDMMHMAAGQSDVSDYAKYCCITWAGEGKHAGTSNEYRSPRGESAWSYPPLKTWITDFGNTLNLIIPESENTVDVPIAGEFTQIIPAQSVWYENNLISTSPVLSENSDYESLKVDGWVGPLQKVDRRETTGILSANHVNGLEGFVTSVDTHSYGPRRWFSGMTGTDYGVGTDTQTYSSNNEVGRHFIHLSFFAPGKDLHDNSWHFGAGSQLYGKDTWMDNLQGIWGGGVFTGTTPDDLFGTATNNDEKHRHLAMEGNYDSSNNILPEAPGPGVGYGYDTSKNYRELHERQWDPTFSYAGDPGNEVRDFIRKLHPGSRFRFHKVASSSPTPAVSETIDTEIYTIKSVQIKKLYNHTSWRKPYNRYIDDSVKYHPTDNTENVAYQSVEEVALTYLNSVDETGVSADGLTDSLATSYDTDRGLDLKKKIVDFGAAHNRRVCYIIEVDKNPADSDWNPLTEDNVMTADFQENDSCDIEFLDPVKDLFLSDLSKFPAIWEVDPKKQQVDLDIYYEASNNIPVKLNDKTNELFAPLGCKVEVLNSNIITTTSSTLQSWNGNVATFYPGLPQGINGNEIDYTEMSFKFIREDGSYTIAQAGQQDLTGEVVDASGEPLLKSDFIFKEDIGDVITAGLSWYNCFSFGNGIESNRIKDDFNEVFISNGVKASTTTQEAYKEERRKSGLIYSGIYNSNSGVNDLNQFIMAEKSTKDLNPTYGSIQKLFQRRISLIAFCEDRVVGIVSNKDTIYNADGNPQLVTSNLVLGDANPFEGDFGISQNPESFASESYRAYFTDKQRGAVLRLSKDGLTPISKAGMQDWFRDNLPNYNTLLGTYDSYKEDYNITLTNDPNFNENLVLDSFLETGIEISDPQEIGSQSVVGNPSGTPLQYLWEDPPNYNVIEYENSSNSFDWSPFTQNDYNLRGVVNVVHHAAIPIGALQQEQNEEGQVALPSGQTETAFEPATYNAWDGSAPSGGTLENDGWWYNPTTTPGRFADASTLHYIFGEYTIDLLDPNVHSTVTRVINDYEITEGSEANIPTDSPLYENPAGFAWATSYHPNSYKHIEYPLPNEYLYNATPPEHISMCITTGSNAENTHDPLGMIVFDRCDPTNSYVEFKHIGHGGSYPTNSGVMNDYYDITLPSGHSGGHSDFYNGDELHIQIELLCYATLPFSISGAQRYGYNYIKPRIEIWDNGAAGGPQMVPWEKLVDFDAIQGQTVYQAVATYNGLGYDPYQYMQSMPEFTDGSHGLGSDFVGITSPINGYIDLSASQTANSNLADYAEVRSIPANPGQATFPVTSEIPPLYSGDYAATNFAGVTGHNKTKSVICGVSFKFRDNNQQQSFGGANFGVTYGASGAAQSGITQVKVVEDLAIRISNDYGSATSAYSNHWSFQYTQAGDTAGDPTSGIYPLRNPLWAIKSVKIKKGFSVVSPSSAYLPPVDPYVHPVDAVPDTHIDAWTEVVHGSNLGFTGASNWEVSSGADMYLEQYLSTHYGARRRPTIETGMGQNPDNSQAPNVPIEYSVPNPSDGANQPTASWIPWGSSNASTFYRYTVFGDANSGEEDGNAVTGNNYSGTDIYHDNEHITIGHQTTTTHSIISHDISGDQWEFDTWYLVDVEWDQDYKSGTTYPTPGAGANAGQDQDGSTNYGALLINGVVPAFDQATQSGTEVNSLNGVGTYRGDGTVIDYSLQLQKVYRTEYGTHKDVLRGIFKMNSGTWYSATEQANINTFKLMAYGCVDGIRINKIITKKLSGTTTWDTWLANNGKANNWTVTSGSANANDPVHAFDKRYIYYYNNKLCWEVPANLMYSITSTPQNTHMWEQGFTVPPGVSTTQWELKFTVSKNNKTNNAFSGNLRGFVATSDATALAEAGVTALGHEGVYFSGIQETGNYLIKFNFNGTISSGDWTFERAPIGDTTNYVAYSGGYMDTVSSWFSGTGSNLIADKIHFSPTSGNAQEYAVSNITLRDSTAIFSGGSAGSWNFDGFDTSLHDYIFWDYEALNLTFNNCPTVDITTPEIKFININQQIDKTINRYEQYEISFTHGITAGSGAKLSIYYYNAEGFGFKIEGIDNSSDGNTGDYFIDTDPNSGTFGEYTTDPPTNEFPGAEPFREIVTIGVADENNTKPLWSNTNQEDPAYNADLKNSFVIQVQGSAATDDRISGYIDNISMVRVYSESDFEATTVSFSEDVKGWTSFKSFIPESGVSISKKYFTFQNGDLYQHYVPKLNGSLGEWTGPLENPVFIKYTAEEANNYNEFYNESAASSIQAVLNQEPSVIKMFNTINYEGSQAYVVRPTSALDEFNNTTITINNAAAWSSGNDIMGWECSEIKTDVDYGSVKEFIEKEGKWFNYIKGLNVDTNAVNTSLFSVQGVGIISSINDVTSTNGGSGGGNSGTGGGGGGGTY